MKKNYIAIVRDHSGSMRSLKSSAVKDYNAIIQDIQKASEAEDQATIVSTVKCGVGPAGRVERDIVNSPVKSLQRMSNYEYAVDGGSTPLFDSVVSAIGVLEDVPDRNDPEVSFLVMVITDGYENSSRTHGSELARMIQKLQSTDRWTFTFRVPRGHARSLETLGIPGGNIFEWEQSDRGFAEATRATTQAIHGFYRSRTEGSTSVQNFYTDLKSVSSQDLKRECNDISKEVEIWKVGSDIELVREFCEKRSKKSFLKGAAFYELVKTENKVQDYKQIVIRDRENGKVYGGDGARQLLGLPSHGTVRIHPGDHSKYDVFIQSTSVNRKLTPHTRVLYWPHVGTPFVEGVSSPWGR